MAYIASHYLLMKDHETFVALDILMQHMHATNFVLIATEVLDCQV